MMTHREWADEFRALLRTGNAVEARRALNRFLRRTQRASRNGVNEWHEGQLIGLIASFADDAGDSDAAHRGFRKLARLRRFQLLESGHGLATALEASGLAAVKAGKVSQARRILRELDRVRQQFPDDTAAGRKLRVALGEPVIRAKRRPR